MLSKNLFKRNLLIALLGFFLIITFLVVTNKIQHIDNKFYSIVEKIIPNQSENIKQNPLTSFFTVITDMGDFYFTIFILAILVIFKKTRTFGYKTSFTILFSVSVNYIIKNIVMRPRPEILRLIHVTGYSFPSGHSMNSMALYTMLIFGTILYIQNKMIKTILICIFSMMPLLIGFSRIYLGVHYLSDVLGGFALGMAIAIFSRLGNLDCTK